MIKKSERTTLLSTSDFEECQKFDQWWLWSIIIIINIVSLWGLFQAVSLTEFLKNPSAHSEVWYTVLLLLGPLVLIYIIRLETKINAHEVAILFFPFINKKILWSDIEHAEVIQYGFVGGWGIRIGTKYGTVYNTKGNIGLAIQLKNGKKYLIGTQQREQLNLLIEKLK